jgi:hypothetical protein
MGIPVLTNESAKHQGKFEDAAKAEFFTEKLAPDDTVFRILIMRPDITA